MPRKITLCCDHPSHGTGEVGGEACYIEMGGKRTEVILCPEHRAPLDELVRLNKGTRVRRTPARGRRVSMDDRVKSLIVTD